MISGLKPKEVADVSKFTAAVISFRILHFDSKIDHCAFHGRLWHRRAEQVEVPILITNETVDIRAAEILELT